MINCTRLSGMLLAGLIGALIAGCAEPRPAPAAWDAGSARAITPSANSGINAPGSTLSGTRETSSDQGSNSDFGINVPAGPNTPDTGSGRFQSPRGYTRPPVARPAN
jgi:hypothetical protein